MLCKSTVILIISSSPPSEHIRLTCTFSGWTADAGHRSPQIHLGRVPACERSAHGGQDFHTGQREKGKRSCLFFFFLSLFRCCVSLLAKKLRFTRHLVRWSCVQLFPHTCAYCRTYKCSGTCDSGSCTQTLGVSVMEFLMP